MAQRILQSLEDHHHPIETVVLPQTVGRSLLMKPEVGKSSPDSRYENSRNFWQDVLCEKLIAERRVKLDKMRLFEWFPRNPGLFHTALAEMARDEAMFHIRHIEEEKFDAYRANADAPPDHAAVIRAVTGRRESTRTQIFTPRGKLSMLQGGIGCVRFEPAIMDDGNRAWFMSATSTSSPDEGIPLLVTDECYQKYIDRIRENGFATVSIRGRVRFIPKRFTDVYAVRNGIPRLYVEVEEIEDAGPDEDYGQVSVAASFAAEFEGRASIYAAYVTFDPGYAGSRASATQWLREEYVQGYYNGELLTDFDQQAPTISGTLFGLNEVMTSPDLAAAILKLRRLHGYFEWSMLERSSINFNEHKEYVRMKVQANENSGNIVIGGDNSNNQLIINNTDLKQLTGDLERLIQALRSEAPSDQRDRAVGALLDAKEAAASGRSQETTSALGRLEPFAKKVLDLGTQIGVPVAIAAIKSAIGI
jgi:hypothetical protein